MLFDSDPLYNGSMVDNELVVTLQRCGRKDGMTLRYMNISSLNEVEKKIQELKTIFAQSGSSWSLICFNWVSENKIDFVFESFIPEVV